MGSLTRRIRRNMCEKFYGSRKELSKIRGEAGGKKRTKLAMNKMYEENANKYKNMRIF